MTVMVFNVFLNGLAVKGIDPPPAQSVVARGASAAARLPLPVLARNARLRSAIIPSAPVNATNTAEVHADAPQHSVPVRLSWARLLERVFDSDIKHCPHCGGTLKIIAAIEDPTVIAKILPHLGLSARAPPRSPARSFNRFHMA